MPTVMKTREKHPGSCRKNDVFTPKIKDSSTCRIHVFCYTQYFDKITGKPYDKPSNILSLNAGTFWIIWLGIPIESNNVDHQMDYSFFVVNPKIHRFPPFIANTNWFWNLELPLESQSMNRVYLLKKQIVILIQKRRNNVMKNQN